eukprot:TRINITY_DN5201_c1_g3_i3.p2 TRINITY_DN5201_c1_g3~~TRINITY_DN5201_c1_g3_i3.p2  ORF type:complete len:193 (+),score=14.95 TRINITY_DN5201_c1_g3_i3:76-654(+)
MMRVTAEERGCLFGRSGVTIQELVRRCRVCICAERKRVIVAGPNAEIVDRAIVLIRGRVENSMLERRQKRSSLLQRGLYTWILNPKDVLASRPSGHWHLENGTLVCGTHRDTSAVLASCDAFTRDLFTDSYRCLDGFHLSSAALGNYWQVQLHHIPQAQQQQHQQQQNKQEARRPISISWKSIAAARCGETR